MPENNNTGCGFCTMHEKNTLRLDILEKAIEEKGEAIDEVVKQLSSISSNLQSAKVAAYCLLFFVASHQIGLFKVLTAALGIGK